MTATKIIKNAISRKYPAIEFDASLQAVMKSMAQNNASALVVKTGQDVIGVVTISDVMDCLADDLDPATTKVSDFMTSCDLVTDRETSNPCAQLDEGQGAIAAIKVMREAGSHHLLVAGDNNMPVGLVSSLELIKLIAT